MTEARFGMVVRFGPGLTDDEADRKEERAKDERWAGASFDVSRRRCREGALPAHPLAKNMMLNV